MMVDPSSLALRSQSLTNSWIRAEQRALKSVWLGLPSMRVILKYVDVVTSLVVSKRRVTRRLRFQNSMVAMAFTPFFKSFDLGKEQNTHYTLTIILCQVIHRIYGWPQLKFSKRLFTKNTGLCKPVRGSIGADA